jgi:hypothetical protein
MTSMDKTIKLEVIGLVIFLGSLWALYLYIKYPDENNSKSNLTKLFTNPVFIMFTGIITTYVLIQGWRLWQWYF